MLEVCSLSIKLSDRVKQSNGDHDRATIDPAQGCTIPKGAMILESSMLGHGLQIRASITGQLLVVLPAQPQRYPRASRLVASCRISTSMLLAGSCNRQMHAQSLPTCTSASRPPCDKQSYKAARLLGLMMCIKCLQQQVDPKGLVLEPFPDLLSAQPPWTTQQTCGRRNYQRGQACSIPARI